MKATYLISAVIVSILYLLGFCSGREYGISCTFMTLLWIAYSLDGILADMKNKQEYEYKFLVKHIDIFQDCINSYGKDGWELVSSGFEQTGFCYAVFKREIRNKEDKK